MGQIAMLVCVAIFVSGVKIIKFKTKKLDCIVSRKSFERFFCW